MTERWEPAHNLPGYEVSTLGRVRTNPDDPDAPGPVARRESRVLARYVTPDGMWQVSGYRDGRGVSISIAPLVARTFIGPRPSGYYTHHEDGDKSNNAVVNLSYRYSGNLTLGRKRHKPDPDSRKGASVVTDAMAEQIRVFAGTDNEAADAFRVALPLVYLIRAGKPWRFE